MKQHKIILAGILVVILFVIAGTFFFVLRNNHQGRNEQSEEKKKEEMYLSLSASDRETADLYAKLYEMSREDVAEQQIKTKDWDKTAKELEKEERVEVAFLLMNGTYTFDEVIKNLEAGKTVKDMKKRDTKG